MHRGSATQRRSPHGTQKEKGKLFRALHAREQAFIIPNPWDAGTARMLAHQGFERWRRPAPAMRVRAGKKDGMVGREGTLANAAEIVAATDCR